MQGTESDAARARSMDQAACSTHASGAARHWVRTSDSWVRGRLWVSDREQLHPSHLFEPRWRSVSNRGVSLTLLGLLAFDPVLWKAGDRFLSGVGTTAYAVAAASWIVATAHALTSHEWPYDREVTYIVAAGA